MEPGAPRLAAGQAYRVRLPTGGRRFASPARAHSPHCRREAKTLISYARRQRNLVNRFPPRLRGKVRDLLVKLSHSGLRPQPAAADRSGL